jgi:tetratricopeptide (TPR) repeat protein
MLRVVDEGRGHALEKYAYRYLGRIALELGETDAAIRPLIRAVAASEGTPDQAGAVVDLAVAYLMGGRPGAANSVLAEHSALFQSNAQIDTAALISSIARLDTAVAPVVKEKAGREVVAALSHVGPADFFGHHGYLVLGQTYERLGLFEPMQHLYSQALQEKIHGELRSRILQELATYYMHSGRRHDALTTLVSMSQDGTDRWQRHALTTMAELALADGRLNQCMKACRDLLQVAQTPQEKGRLLQLMGRVYQQEDNYYYAALCFAGMLPTDANATAPKDE